MYGNPQENYATFHGSTYINFPLQDWAGPEGSRRLKLPDFKTLGT